MFSALHVIRLSFCFDFLCVHCVLHIPPLTSLMNALLSLSDPSYFPIFSLYSISCFSIFCSSYFYFIISSPCILNFLMPLSFSLNLFPPSSLIFLYFILPLHLISSSFYINWFLFFFNSSVSCLSLSLDFILLTFLFLSRLLLASPEYPVMWPAHLCFKGVKENKEQK